MFCTILWGNKWSNEVSLSWKASRRPLKGGYILGGLWIVAVAYIECLNRFKYIVVVVQSLSGVRFLRPHELQPARLLCPWNSPRKNTGVDCHVLLQGIFPTQRSNSRLLLCRRVCVCVCVCVCKHLWCYISYFNPSNNPMRVATVILFSHITLRLKEVKELDQLRN